MIKELIKLATHLDERGLVREADYLDAVVRKIASDGHNLEDIIIDRFNSLNPMPITYEDLGYKNPATHARTYRGAVQLKYSIIREIISALLDITSPGDGTHEVERGRTEKELKNLNIAFMPDDLSSLPEEFFIHGYPHEDTDYDKYGGKSLGPGTPIPKSVEEKWREGEREGGEQHSLDVDYHYSPKDYDHKWEGQDDF